MAQKTRAAQVAGVMFPLFALLGACALTTDEGGESETSPAALEPAGSTRAHLMPMRWPGDELDAPAAKDPGSSSAPPGTHLNYYGGPVLPNVKVWTVFWSSNIERQSDLNAFYGAITQSAYFDWLTEYNTQTQSIGRGSFGGSVVLSDAPAGQSINDTQIQAELAKLIESGKLPPNDENNLYMVYFPPGVSIIQGGAKSCVQFCAYHSTFVRGGKHAYYGVIPDLGGGCAGGCGNGDKFQNTTSASSHELIEAVTDPAVGLAKGMSAPLAWYDTQYGEIGDMCNTQRAVVSGYTVQKEFSNQLNDCIATKSGGGGTGGGGTGSGGTGGAGGGGTGGTGGTGSGGTGSGGGTCGHPLCSPGPRLDPACDPCVNQICSFDPHCCISVWDNSCVQKVPQICGQTCGGGTGSGGGGGTCGHPICAPGPKLKPFCDPCVAQICSVDPHCCAQFWDQSCVSKVPMMCGQTCP